MRKEEENRRGREEREEVEMQSTAEQSRAEHSAAQRFDSIGKVGCDNQVKARVCINRGRTCFGNGRLRAKKDPTDQRESVKVR